MAEATNRREQLADAAIATLASAGMRGLTHRAVDQAAGVPEGSCSYYFRTRQALLRAAVDRLAEMDSAEMAARGLPRDRPDISELADAAAELIEHWVTAGKTRMLARYELALESTRRPELRAVLVEAGGQVRRLAEDLLAAAGAPDPPGQAPVLVACVDGIVFDHLAGAGALTLSPGELRATLLALLRTFIQER
ncbi:TetR family transcriptional regulator [Amycolatopsis cynarae]|uniref:TetR family transcriptional regulator n=1 Tax=Amycolatopsis cynarae TaxID=2995223 RepID=A0ABY7BD61_9PSEU|nr:TetR/AcrR family transcriptional regulator [Amycolatopsis sp. HUAS 11-8]WAL68851.1 TetR family transcriptional regulator [Amycolatopsis sp. HUAS 11-8]